MEFLVLGSYSILILTYSQLLSLATLLAIMDTLILGDSIIKYLQKDFVHKNVHVKAFPGYNISRLHARLDTDVVSNYSNIILHVGVNDITNASPALILQKYEAMLATLKDFNAR